MRVILRDALGADGLGLDEPTAVNCGSSIGLCIFTSLVERLKRHFPGTTRFATTQQVFGADAQVHQRSAAQQHGR